MFKRNLPFLAIFYLKIQCFVAIVKIFTVSLDSKSEVQTMAEGRHYPIWAENENCSLHVQPQCRNGRKESPLKKTWTPFAFSALNPLLQVTLTRTRTRYSHSPYFMISICSAATPGSAGEYKSRRVLRNLSHFSVEMYLYAQGARAAVYISPE